MSGPHAKVFFALPDELALLVVPPLDVLDDVVVPEEDDDDEVAVIVPLEDVEDPVPPPSQAMQTVETRKAIRRESDITPVLLPRLSYSASGTLDAVVPDAPVSTCRDDHGSFMAGFDHSPG